MGKGKLLYISPQIPQSTGGGTPMRAASHIKVLSQLFEVTLAMVGPYVSEVEVEKRLTADVRAACASVLVINRNAVINRVLRRTRSAWARLLFEALWPVPVEVPPCRLALAELGIRVAGKSFDVVHCFRLYTASLRSLRRHDVSIGRAVLDLDDYQSKAGFRSTLAVRSVAGKRQAVLSWVTALKWWILESLLIPSFADALVCSELDQQTLRSRFPGINWHAVPNIVNPPPEFHPIDQPRFTFLFVGRFDYVVNSDAILFFCTSVMPLLRQRAPGKFRVLIVGRAGYYLNTIRAVMANEEVRIILDPPDLLPYYAQSDVIVVPLRSGGGTRIKILEAFSYGLPVVSTTVGAEGLDVTPSSDIVIADCAQDFAEQCLRLWRDEPLRRQIATRGRDLWRRKYSPATLVTAFNEVYGGTSDDRSIPSNPEHEAACNWFTQ
jgi:polysaccharide biosynthesis protein PslH